MFSCGQQVWVCLQRQLHLTNARQNVSSDKRAGTNSTHDGKWRTVSIFLWHAILLVTVARWPRHIFKCLHWSHAWSTPSLREPDCQTYIFLYALPFRNNKMLGWDAINFFFPLLEYAAYLQVQQCVCVIFFFFFFFTRMITNIFQILTFSVWI